MVNWRDIQDKAEVFIHEYKGASKEDSEAKAFWVRFFDVFGVRERSVGLFEKRVKLLKGGDGKIDFFAPGRFMVEHKSLDKDLDKAFKQAAEYIDALSEDEKPRYLILCDFDRFRVYDFEAGGKKSEVEFNLKDLPQKTRLFSFLTDEKVQDYKEEDPINVRAVRAIGKLYDALKASNYPPEHISPLLTRLVFCFFADDTGIFNKNDLRRYIENNTKEDGSDIGQHLGVVFQVLDTPEQSRQTTTDDTLAAMPYVNGGLFKGHLPAVFGSRAVRDTLISCLRFDWSNISPAIFGSMFQSIMNEKERHDLGAHYTSEENILKIINGLFLNDFKSELDVAKTNHDKLNTLWEKIARVELLDPACGCGNFLVIAYRELRVLENEIIRRLHGKADKRAVAHSESHGRLELGEVDLATISKLSIERMHGIELEAFPAEVAKLSLWLMDHMMNAELGRIFGKPLRKLPLTEAPHIVLGNALRVNWESVVPKNKLTHILGNPPFLGSRIMEKEQKSDLEHVFSKTRKVGELDYVTGWYIKASEYIQDTKICVAFVSTNSITQGEQVAILWPQLLNKGIKIRFAHRTFKWSNEAPGKAAVYCVIVGFDLESGGKRSIYLYDDIRGEPERKEAKNINPYLVDAPDVYVESRRKPLCDAPPAAFGSMPNDGGSFLFDDEKEKDEFLKREPNAAQFIRLLVSAKEYLQGGQRYCLWLKDALPEQIKSMPEVLGRVEAVRQLRTVSTRTATRTLAATPYLWGEDRQPSSPYIVVPLTSSENRTYVPLSILEPTTIANNTCGVIQNTTRYHLGVLQSEMHMAWMRAVAGRLKSDYRYSNELVYNNFPWPEKPTEAQKKAVEEAAQQVLDIRNKYPGSTLANLYDPNTMRADLLKAHKTLDKAVDDCYGVRGFKSEPERLQFLFEQYQKLVSLEIKPLKKAKKAK